MKLTLILFVLIFVSCQDKSQLNRQLSEAVRKGDVEKVSYLIDKGANVNKGFVQSKTPKSQTAFLHAIVITVIRLSRDNIPDFQNDYLDKYYHTVRIMLEKGAEVNAQDENGFTALHYVAKFSLINQNTRSYPMKLSKLLIVHGASVNMRKRDGKTPLDLGESVEMRKLLIEHGAKSGD